jgi:hypothetical protein
MHDLSRALVAVGVRSVLQIFSASSPPSDVECTVCTERSAPAELGEVLSDSIKKVPRIRYIVYFIRGIYFVYAEILSFPAQLDEVEFSARSAFSSLQVNLARQRRI